MANPDPLPVLHEFLPPDLIRQIEPLGNAGGWSGSLLWRVPAGDRSYCLRRWPERTSPQRLRFIHQILTHVASQGIDFVPAPMPLLRRTSVSLVQTGDNFLWDLCPWLPGSADYRANPSRTRLTAAMQALAQFHVAAADGQASNTGPAPAVIERIERAQQLLSGDFQRIAAAVGSGLEAALDLRAVRLLAQAHPQLANLPLRLEVIASVNLPLSPAIRDIHHDHVLFTGDKVTGLIDFGALRIDTPLADIARLVGSLVGDDQPAREFALNAYRELRPLSRQEHGHIDVLDRSGLVLGGLNWLRWLYLDRRDMGPLPPIVKRIDEILARLLVWPT